MLINVTNAHLNILSKQVSKLIY